MKTFAVALGILLALAAAYVGSYYAFVTRIASWPGPASTMHGKLGLIIHYHPVYSIGGDAACQFYAPWHACDRWLRPDAWQEFFELK